jgi:pre-mRNA-processing factor 6
MQSEKPSISENFSDLKRELVKVSYEDWLNLPDSADSSIKRQKRDKYVPVPDYLIAGLVNNSKMSNK